MSGLELIRAVQELRNPVLDVAFLALTGTGAAEFYLLLFPVLIWCVHYGAGVRVALLFLASSLVNAELKALFELPRPVDLAPELGLVSTRGFGMPSGHAQNAVVVWGGLAAALGSGAAWAAAGLLALGIGLSRLYLGVHFAADVVVGWAIGAAILTVALLGRRAAPEGGLLDGPRRAAAFVLAGVGTAAVRPVPDVLAAAGALAGAGAGWSFVGTDGPEVGPRSLRAGVRRLALGLPPVALLYAASRWGPAVDGPWRFVAFALIGSWITLGAPRAFRALGW